MTLQQQCTPYAMVTHGVPSSRGDPTLKLKHITVMSMHTAQAFSIVRTNATSHISSRPFGWSKHLALRGHPLQGIVESLGSSCISHQMKTQLAGLHGAARQGTPGMVYSSRMSSMRAFSRAQALTENDNFAALACFVVSAALRSCNSAFSTTCSMASTASLQRDSSPPYVKPHYLSRELFAAR